MAKKFRYLFLYVLLVRGGGYLFMRLPSAYLPNEDQGILMCQIMMPTAPRWR